MNSKEDRENREEQLNKLETQTNTQMEERGTKKNPDFWEMRRTCSQLLFHIYHTPVYVASGMIFPHKVWMSPNFMSAPLEG